MTYRLRNLVIAVVLAVSAALLTAMYVTNYERRVDGRQERVGVFVATKDISPGTPWSQVEGSLTKREVPRESVSPTALASLGQLQGQAASQWTYAGEQVTLRHFAPPTESGIRGELKGTMRALQLTGEPEQLLAGTLKVGDRVDVVANIKINPSVDVYAARTVLRDLRVLKIAGDDTASKLSNGGQSSLAVILEARDSQVPKLLFITSKTGHFWTLQLRPVTDPADSPETVETVKSVLRDGLAGRTP